MKALFISYNQGITERVMHIFDHNGVKGYTLFPLTNGRGSFEGEPHMGSHTWPSMNSSILSIMDKDKIGPVMADLRELDKETQLQGMRAFVWDITDSM